MSADYFPSSPEDVCDWTQNFITVAPARLLALGWSQATVTYEWPDSEIWRGIFASPPPEQWLPRLYFELCYLTHDPNLREHYDAFFDALNRGLADPELSIVAEKLKELFPPYEIAN